MILVQVVLGIIIYGLLSKMTNNESYDAIKNMIEEKLNANKKII